MLTPQQIQETSFEKALFGGYDMDSVDDFLEPLTADYVTLYKENSVLKSKMRILVEKLEEYRKNEASSQAALLAAQKTCEQMVADAERKSAQILRDAEQAAGEKAKEALVQTEEDKLKSAQEATSDYLDTAEELLKKQLELLKTLREKTPQPEQERPRVHQFTRPPVDPLAPQQVSAPVREHKAFDFDADKSHPSVEDKADAFIEEIDPSTEQSMRASAPAARQDADATRRFESLPPEKQKKFEDLQFGRNYDPKNSR